MEWRDVPGFEGIIQVSDEGQVRSLPHTRIRGNGTPYTVTGKVLRPGWSDASYYTVNIRDREGHKSTHKVHVLVLQAFVGPRPDGLVARHLNGNSADNRRTNLVWGTYSENTYDKQRHGTDHQMAKTHCPAGHPYDEENTYRMPGRNYRRCKQCDRDAGARYRARKRLARLESA